MIICVIMFCVTFILGNGPTDINTLIKLGANAIIGIEYNVTSIASNMIVASAIGTAVCVEK